MRVSRVSIRAVAGTAGCPFELWLVAVNHACLKLRTTNTHTPPHTHTDTSHHSPLLCTRLDPVATTPQCLPPLPCHPALPAVRLHARQQQQQWRAPTDNGGCCCQCSGCRSHTPCTCACCKVCLYVCESGGKMWCCVGKVVCWCGAVKIYTKQA